MKRSCANHFARGRRSSDGRALFVLRLGLVLVLAAGRLLAADPAPPGSGAMPGRPADLYPHDEVVLPPTPARGGRFKPERDDRLTGWLAGKIVSEEAGYGSDPAEIAPPEIRLHPAAGSARVTFDVTGAFTDVVLAVWIDGRADESAAGGPVNRTRVRFLVDGREKVNLLIDQSTNAHAALDLTGASELTVVAASEEEQEREGAVILGVVSAGK